MAMKNPVLVLGAGAAALALAASSKKKRGATGGSEAERKFLKRYDNSVITVEPDGSRMYVGMRWVHDQLIPLLNEYKDTKFDMIDDAYLQAAVIAQTDFRNPSGKALAWDDIPDTAVKEEFQNSIRSITKAYRQAREGGIAEVMLGHYSKIMAQYKCELPDSDEYLPPSCMISLALGNI